MRDTATWENHTPRRRCMTPRCGEWAVAGRSRCGKCGPPNAKWWSGLGTNPYTHNTERRLGRIEAGETCTMAYLGDCHGPLHLDHIIPLSLDGLAVPGNEQLLCERHNIKKGGRNRIKKV